MVEALKILGSNMDWEAEGTLLPYLAECFAKMQMFRDLIFQDWVYKDIAPEQIQLSYDIIPKTWRDSEFEQSLLVETLKAMDQRDEIVFGGQGIQLTRKGVEIVRKRATKLPNQLQRAYLGWFKKYEL